MESFDLVLVKEFWDWFKSIAYDLSISPIDNNLIDKIDLLVAQIGHIDWEIGPWKNEMHYFALSPNLDEQKLELVSRIISYAPQIDGWIFLDSKPPKDWQGIWKMKNSFGENVQIDCSEWKYIMFQFEDKSFDIELLVSELDPNIVDQAIDIALTGYLGEKTYIENIKNVIVVENFSVNSTPTSLKYISKHLQSLGF